MNYSIPISKLSTGSELENHLKETNTASFEPASNFHPEIRHRKNWRMATRQRKPCGTKSTRKEEKAEWERCCQECAIAPRLQVFPPTKRPSTETPGNCPFEKPGNSLKKALLSDKRRQ